MFWDTGRATRRTMHAGAKSRSSCALREDCRRSTFSPKQATTRQATNFVFSIIRPFSHLILALCAMALFVAPCLAQIPLLDKALCNRVLISRGASALCLLALHRCCDAMMLWCYDATMIRCRMRLKLKLNNFAAPILYLLHTPSPPIPPKPDCHYHISHVPFSCFIFLVGFAWKVFNAPYIVIFSFTFFFFFFLFSQLLGID